MKTKIIEAVRIMSTCKYFPSEPGSREAVMQLLERMCGQNEAGLRWLAITVVNYVGEWPGPAQLRALYATRFAPADGIEGAHCSIAGFTPADSERAVLEAHENLKVEGVRTPGMKRISAGTENIQ